MFSEDSKSREGTPRPGRSPAVRQVQVTDTLYESVCNVADLFLGRLQSLAAQVLPALQPDCV